MKDTFLKTGCEIVNLLYCKTTDHLSLLCSTSLFINTLKSSISPFFRKKQIHVPYTWIFSLPREEAGDILKKSWIFLIIPCCFFWLLMALDFYCLTSFSLQIPGSEFLHYQVCSTILYQKEVHEHPTWFKTEIRNGVF